MTIYFCFDVESVGLYGEGFAVGYCVSDGEKEIESGIFNCPLHTAKGNTEDNNWVRKNVVPHLPEPNCEYPEEVRYKFWEVLQRYKEEEEYKEGLVVLVDCGYPVEYRFLKDCVLVSPETRKWEVPYPIHEVGTALLLTGQNPLENYERLPNEMPKHNPLADARQSLRLFLECSNYLGTKTAKTKTIVDDLLKKVDEAEKEKLKAWYIANFNRPQQ